MLVLIKREIEDNIVMFVIAVLMAMILAAVMVVAVTERNADQPSPTGVSNTMFQTLTATLPISAAMLAAVFALVQSYIDRTRNMPTFLATLATTRGRILSARVAAGMILICVVVLPVAATAVVLLRNYHVSPISDMYVALALRVAATTFLLAMASYCVALRTSLNAGVVMTVFAAIMLTSVLISVTVIKGFTCQAMVLYLVVIVTSVMLAWRKFAESPL